MEKVNFNLDILFQEVHPKTKELGLEYFLSKKVTENSWYNEAEDIVVNAVCNSYKLYFKIFNSSFTNHYCQCFSGSKGVICKHIVAAVYDLNEKANEARLFLNVSTKKYEAFISDHNLGDLIKYLNSIKDCETLPFFEIVPKPNNITILVNNNLTKYTIDDFENLLELINIIDNDKQTSSSLIKSFKEQITFSIKLYKKLVELSPSNKFKFLLTDDDIDELFAFIQEIYGSTKFKWMYLNNQGLIYINNFYKDKKIKIKYNVINTNLGFHISTNCNIVSITSNWNNTYVFITNPQKELEVYSFPTFDHDIMKSFEDLNIFCKDSKILVKKINRIEKNPYLIIVNDEEDQKHEPIILNIKLQDDNKVILASIKHDDLKHLILKNKIDVFLPFIEANNQFSYKSFNEFKEFYKKVMPFIEKGIVSCDLPEVIKKIVDENNQDKIDFKFNLSKDNDIGINFTINEHTISSNKLKQLYKMRKANEQSSLGFVSIGKDILNINKLDFVGWEKYLNILGIDDTHQDVDRIKIFYIAKEFKEQHFIDFVTKFEQASVELDLDEQILNTLKPYQLYGVKWIKKMLDFANGCILADEMGLGKTFQTISYINDWSKTNKKPILIICPFSLVVNWKNEFQKFDPSKQIIEIDGSLKQRSIIINKIKPDENMIYICNYHKYINDYQMYKNIGFGLIILDEGQYIKNNTTKWTSNIKKIKADKRLILTGTPIENNILEIWSLFEFILPGYLPSQKKFNQFFSKNNQDSLNELAFLIKPFILQRKKINELPELPDKKQEQVFIEMSTEEREKYDELYNLVKKDVSNFFKEEDKANNQKLKMNILALITKLRQFCCDPCLVSMENIVSNKFKYCLSLIKKILENPVNKIVIFCSFTTLLDSLESFLNQNGYQTIKLTGKNNQKQREELINEFNKSNSSILLISLKAGGVGINLNTANIVIHFNPWWNDSVENQAADRLHRIGQKNEVTVYNLIYNHSIEEQIMKLKQSKNQVINTTISNASYIELFKLINKE